MIYLKGDKVRARYDLIRGGRITVEKGKEYTVNSGEAAGIELNDGWWYQASDFYPSFHIGDKIKPTIAKNPGAFDGILLNSILDRSDVFWVVSCVKDNMVSLEGVPCWLGAEGFRLLKEEKSFNIGQTVWVEADGGKILKGTLLEIRKEFHGPTGSMVSRALVGLENGRRVDGPLSLCHGSEKEAYRRI